MQLDYDAWKSITERIVKLRLNPATVILSMEETKEILQFWGQVVKQEYGSYQHVSLRSYDKTIQVFARMKLLFGCLSPELINICKRLSKRVIKPHIPKTRITQIIKQRGEISRAELCKEYAGQEGISLRQAQRKVKEALESGEIKRIGILNYIN